MPSTNRFVSVLVLSIVGISNASAVHGQSLHERIDQEIEKGTKDYRAGAAASADDAEFCRRIYLDLTGMIPTAAEARAFFADPSADKRVKLVDKLLASPRFARHLQHTFDTLLMDRRPGKQVKDAEWREFLFKAFAANKPYDEFVREILSADGSDPKLRAAARFYLDRDGEPHQLTKDISRVFLGMNLHCAQCHDHPLVDAYKQEHYYGIYAFLNRSYLFKDAKKKQAILAEKAEGDVTFQSVFLAKVTKKTGPRLPEGAEVKEPSFPKGQEYVKPPKKGEAGVPKFSRRDQLAELLTSPDNPRFARAAVNRFWSLLLGRGIVNPVEYDHPGNPPSHPDLLDHLAREFVKHKYDVRWLVREIILSQTYQRSSAPAAGSKEFDAKSFAVALLRPLSPEQFGWSTLQATGAVEIEKGAEAAVYAKLSAQVATFSQLFGTTPGEPADNQDFEATLDQTLFLKNGNLIRTLLVPRAGNLTERLAKLKTPDEIAEELYLSILTRMPVAEEKQEVARFLKSGSDRGRALQDLAWALLTSAEFRFNH